MTLNLLVLAASSGIFSLVVLSGCQTTKSFLTASIVIKEIELIKLVSELTITNDLLRFYQKRLVSAVNSDNNTIIELSRPDLLVVTYFGYYQYR